MNPAVCRTCGQPISLVALDTGSWAPVEPIPLGRSDRREPRAGQVVYNPRTGKGRIVRKDELGDALLWLFRGGALYRRHFDRKEMAA